MTPLLLGGDHSLAAGSVSGVADFYRAAEARRSALVWIDAHSDINTPETSPSGNVHGMPLAALLGLGPEPLANIFGYAPKIAAEKHGADRGARHRCGGAGEHSRAPGWPRCTPCATSTSAACGP